LLDPVTLPKTSVRQPGSSLTLIADSKEAEAVIYFRNKR